VFTGSANLTGAGFRTNWENSYYITIPEVVQQFADHYVKMWDSMATGINDLPKEGIVNEYLEDQPEIKK
jgi:phosphatidylserine/phosphatidylglycerophosphate/cardiolipin synthase-like enzyme